MAIEIDDIYKGVRLHESDLLLRRTSAGTPREIALKLDMAQKMIHLDGDAFFSNMLMGVSNTSAFTTGVENIAYGVNLTLTGTASNVTMFGQDITMGGNVGSGNTFFGQSISCTDAAVGSTDNTMIGRRLSFGNASSGSVLIGQDMDIVNGRSNIIGIGRNNTVHGGTSVFIGYNIVNATSGTTGAITMGFGTGAGGSNSIIIGTNANVTGFAHQGQNVVYIGTSAGPTLSPGSGHNATAVGNSAKASAAAAAYGWMAEANGQQSIAFGRESVSSGTGCISLGSFALSAGQYSLSLGYLAGNTASSSSYVISLGYGANSTAAGAGNLAQQGTAIGYYALSGNQANNIAVGTRAQVLSGLQSTILGFQATAKQSYTVSLGSNAGNTTGTHGTSTISIGRDANQGTHNIGQYSIGIGYLVTNVGNNTIAFGRSAKTGNEGEMSFGYSAGNTTGSHGNYAINFGYFANQGTHNIGNDSITIGRTTINSSLNGIAIGLSSTLTGARSIILNSSGLARTNANVNSFMVYTSNTNVNPVMEVSETKIQFGIAFAGAGDRSLYAQADGTVITKDIPTLPTYTLATATPALAAANTGGYIWVSNESGGPTVAVSNGTNWLRVSDGSPIS